MLLGFVGMKTDFHVINIDKFGVSNGVEIKVRTCLCTQSLS